MELLAPAKNADIGICAINCGADAVYIGAPQFGARAAAGNSISDIERLTRYAHLFGCRVLVTLNTILTDNELQQANHIAWDLYNAGADALIIQDFGLLETNLPPIRLHASTQCNNQTVEHIRWIENLGFSRVVLARELSLEQIKEIRKSTHIELEAFIHGALCVSYSGQCYLSEALCGRSANRGECAQMCRLPYDLFDADGNQLLHQKHLLSLCDMDRSASIKELIDAGVTTFKIEGRLKDENYVKNIVTYYRHLLDQLQIQNNDDIFTQPTFSPNPAKTFHRSQTDYFLHGRTHPLANFESPKSTGEPIGNVVNIGRNNIVVKTNDTLNIGDGICIGSEGFNIQNIQRNGTQTTLFWNPQFSNINTSQLRPGMAAFRNYDKQFNDLLSHFNPQRKIPVSITLQDIDDGFKLTFKTRHTTIQQSFKQEKQIAQNQDKAISTIHTQLSKFGDTIFIAKHIDIQLSTAYFLPISVLNTWRRAMTDKLQAEILNNYERPEQSPIHPAPFYSDRPLDYHANIHNSKARLFYEKCGAKITEPAFEQTHRADAELMRCRYCLKYEMGWCKIRQHATVTPKEPLYIQRNNQSLQLHFDCKNCEMVIKKKQ